MESLSITPKKLKEAWLSFFRERGHEIIPTHSVVPPPEDSSILFINAGLCVLKKAFISQTEERRAFTNVQKVIRTVDINSIEEDGWHSTYFEMMGNFSVGKYFKSEAIEYAVKFLGEVLRLDLDKLIITVHRKDLESEGLWKSLLGEKVEIVKLDAQNFWSAGSGPCGPCTEIFYDRGLEFDSQSLGLRLLQEGIDNERYIEIWNIVFSQYWEEKGEYKELKYKNIDTGAGLERIITVLEGVKNVFFSSQFFPIIQKLEERSGKRYLGQKDEESAQFQVVADHMRTLMILLGEGLVPENKGRGYVIKKLARRAFCALYLLGLEKLSSVLVELSNTSLNLLSELYPDLKDKKEVICAELIKEWEVYQKVIDKTQQKLNQMLDNRRELDLEREIFTLVEREGAPLPIVRYGLKQRGVNFSEERLESFFREHREGSKNQKFSTAFELKT